MSRQKHESGESVSDYETKIKVNKKEFLSCIDSAAFAADVILIGNGKRETNFVHSIILKKELNIHGSRNALKDDFINNIDTVASGKADVMKMVSSVYDMADALDAFKALADNDGTLAKILIKIGE